MIPKNILFFWLKLVFPLNFIYAVKQITIVSMVFEKEQQQDISAVSSEIVKMVNTNTRRIRAIEQRLYGSERRIGSLEEKVIDEMDDLRRGFEQISLDIKAVSESLSEIRSEILKLNKNLDKTAKKSEVKELESLIDLYNPIKSKFVTRDEVERLIEEKPENKT